jgi:hypothetical protein
MQIKTYNKGTIIGITYPNGSTSYRYANGTPLVSRSIISRLSFDKTKITCASFECICDINSLLSNEGYCLLSNSGEYLTRNNVFI